jgi:hypothetical protein
MKQETPEQLKNVYLDGYVDGSRAQAKLMYNEEEVIDIAKQAFILGKDFGLIGTFNEWFEQFKKK